MRIRVWTTNALLAREGNATFSWPFALVAADTLADTVLTYQCGLIGASRRQANCFVLEVTEDHRLVRQAHALISSTNRRQPDTMPETASKGV